MVCGNTVIVVWVGVASVVGWWESKGGEKRIRGEGRDASGCGDGERCDICVGVGEMDRK